MRGGASHWFAPPLCIWLRLRSVRRMHTPSAGFVAACQHSRSSLVMHITRRSSYSLLNQEKTSIWNWKK
jgi:hypothetical protein